MRRRGPATARDGSREDERVRGLFAQHCLRGVGSGAGGAPDQSAEIPAGGLEDCGGFGAGRPIGHTPRGWDALEVDWLRIAGRIDFLSR